jgi:hypothetical protein
MKYVVRIWLGVCCWWGLQALAHEGHTQYAENALAISVTSDANGQLWRAQVKQGQVWVDSSADLGQHFSPAVVVNSKPMKIAADGEARPKIAVSPAGQIYLSWTESLKKPYAGYIWFARSVDGGKSFEAPLVVHRDRAEITHRFDALHVSPNGKITVAWVDKRDLITSKEKGKPYDGAAIYYAVSNNQGKSFEPEQKLADSSCECCRIAITNKPDATVAVLWRHVFAGSERDHAMVEIGTDMTTPKIVRASYGHWQIDGCPHHGAALAYGQGFGYHLAYFDGAGERPSMMVSRMDGEAWVTSPPKKFGNMQNQAGHPALLSRGEQVWLVWRERLVSGASQIIDMTSKDGGHSWSAPAELLNVPGKLDYPQLLMIKESPYLAVNTQHQGLKLIQLH